MTTLAWAVLILAQAQEAKRAGIAAYDTVQSSREPLSLSAREKWVAFPPSTAGPLKGDAVITNGRISAVVRRADASVELYAGEAAPRARLVLQGADGAPAARLASVALADYTRGSVSLDATFKTAGGADLAAKFRIKRGDVALEIEPGPQPARVRVEAPARYAVLPDFFADDILVDAARLPLETAEIPSENFLIQLAGQGDCLVMCVFENREQDVRVSLAGEKEKRVITGSEIQFGKERKKVWVALLEGPRIWHAAEVAAGDAGKVVPLDWTFPFPAQWRVDFTRADDLTHSWDLLLQEKEGGEYLKPTWMSGGFERVGKDRKRWTGSLMYSVVYPCWSDAQGKGYLQPLKNRWVSYRGPVAIYPANRVAKTPLEAFTVVDIVRNTLGQGPCEYILDVEGNKAERKGRATCSVRDELKAIYERGEQKQRRKDIEGFLQQGIDFVKHIRGRIEGYLDFARQTREYLEAQKKAKPELASEIDRLMKVLAEVDDHLGERKAKIKTPEHVVAMTEEFRRTLLDYQGPDAAERVKKYTEELTDIGGNQDDLVARLRWVVKNLRQRSGMMMTVNPKFAPVAEEIRVRTQKVLRNPAIHEENRP